MDTQTYEERMETLLADSTTYEILKKNPTEEKKNTQNSPETILETGKITPSSHNKYHCPKYTKRTLHSAPL